ncbi:dihydrolipoyl dehydrogenase [Acidihalobacter ferrooxydans]|uniref:Dihydrolipoyl dehydrogenase n=1 Tax=Acidihalobacter ferrooxydans TaxID=1765967 RepID=A0A1P8UK49_9GAMM|nr:dihydrolipoyl dehydrogenase [Acidihalobacter ferrooxydans]APZ44209.1 dihydrolipoyl dehydrogenase [Acidihalobacter ferrooxydans]
MRKVRIAILGAGSAGLTALAQVRKHTDEFVIVNHGPYGTTCARVGCMPSKALIQAADDYHRRHDFDTLGILGGEGLSVDIAAVLQRVRDYRDARVNGVLGATDQLGERSIAGRARLDGPQRIVVERADGGDDEVIEAEQVIIATGTRPVVPAPWRAFAERVITTDDVFECATLPRRIAVIGLGVIGVELGQALARFGLDVVGYEMRESLGSLSDPVVQEAARQSMGEEFPLHLGRAVELREGAGGIVVDDGREAHEFDQVLAAMGRRPNIDGLGLETLGVPLDRRGLPEFDRHTLRVGELPVFITGDVNGELQLLHEASDEGFIAAWNALHGPTRFRRRVPLAIAFTDPQIAVVGQSYAELAGREDLVVGEFDFSRQARALAMLKGSGMARIYAARGTGLLLGAEMLAPAAEHFAHLLALAIQREMSVAELLTLPFYHPTLEEGLRSALRALAKDIYGEAPLELATL